VRTCAYLEVIVVQCVSEPSTNCSSDEPTMYVFPMEKHELEFVTSTCAMSCNVLLQDCTRHTRTLPPLLTSFEDNCEDNLRGLSSFNEEVNGTQECALGERAFSRCTHESWQVFAIGASPRGIVTQLYGVPHSTGAREVECRHH
jgi:hypothetical protein